MGDRAEDVEGVRKELLEFPAITPTPSALPLEDGEPCILQVSDENNARRRVNLLQVQLWITQEERWSRGHHILEQVGNDGERHDVVQLLNVSVVIMLQVLGDLEHLGKGEGGGMGHGRWEMGWEMGHDGMGLGTFVRPMIAQQRQPRASQNISFRANMVWACS